MEQYRNIFGKNPQKVRYFVIKTGNGMQCWCRLKNLSLELEGEGTVDIINVKCEPDMVGVLIETYGFLPGYHMNKEHWITMLMDGTVSEAKILDFLDMSYDLIDRSW